jgi:hypothetical protein
VGSSLDAYLAYGHRLGSPDEEFRGGIKNLHQLPWYSDEDSFQDLIDAELFRMVGFDENRERGSRTYVAERNAAKERLGVEVRSGGVSGYNDYILCANGSVYTAYYDFASINPRVPVGADYNLAAAVKYLGLELSQSQPSWLLGAAYR